MRMLWGSVLFVFVVSGCFCSQPVSGPASPSTGSYGTLVTITGKDFGVPRDGGDDDLKVLLENGPQLLPRNFDPDAGESWADDKIVFRYPFPAHGTIRVDGPGGLRAAGTFTPTWLPKARVDNQLYVHGPFSRVVKLPSGGIAAVIRSNSTDPGDPRLVVFDGSKLERYVLPVPGGGATLAIDVVAGASGSEPPGFAIAGQPMATTLHRLSWSGGKPTLTSLQFSVAQDLPMVAAVDADTVWVRGTDQNFHRLKVSGTTVTDEKSVMPATEFKGPAFASVFLEASGLVAQWTTGRDAFLKHYETPSFQRLDRPMAAPVFRANREVDGYLREVLAVRGPNGGTVLTWQGGYDLAFDVSKVSTTYSAVLPAGMDALENAPKVSSTLSSKLTPLGSGYAAAFCAPGGIRVGPVATPFPVELPDTFGEVAIWPCPRLFQPVEMPDGKSALFAEHAGALYLVTH